MFHRAIVVALVLILPSAALAQGKAKSKQAKQPPDRPTPTAADFAYGENSERQKFDFWKAESDQPTPLVLLIHGGGWRGGDKSGYGTSAIQPYLDAGISVAAINYRFIPQAMEQKVEPPVKACLYDAARALQTLRSKAKEWNLDRKRVGATGSSAGACTSLWLALHDDLADPNSSDPIARESSRLTCAAVVGAQTSLDPKELREWIPNAVYGGHAFGFAAPKRGRPEEFDLLIANREKVLPWIKEYSPIELVTKDDPPIYLDYPNQKAPPKIGQQEADPTHSAMYGVQLADRLQAAGVEAILAYPGHDDTKYGSVTKFLIEKLNKNPADGQAGKDATPKTLAGQISFALIDLAGQAHQLGQNDRRRTRVYVFLSPECPIANSYTRTLGELVRSLEAANRPVELFAVISDPTIKRSKAADHYREFAAEFPVLFDASGELARALQPTHTPEAFVLDADGRLAYRGKIDDAYTELGHRRPKVEHAYLADAIEATVAGQPVATARTEPVGCLFETLPAGADDAEVTYTRDIAPLIHTRCMNCHRQGEVAPFPLTNYEEVAKRAGQLARVTGERIMPPWKPAPGHETFVGERWLSDAQIALFARWAKTGRTQGDPADEPPPPKFAEGWQLGEPDLVLTMQHDYTVPPDGPDLLQHFVIPTDMGDDKLVAAVEFRPGNRRVVHHCVMFLDSNGAARKLDAATPEPGYLRFGSPGFIPTGGVGGWSVGNTARPLPNGMGRYLKKGSDLVMQVHYHPSGKEEVDRSSVGLYFVDKPIEQLRAEPAKSVGAIWMANYQIDIAPGDKDFRRSTTYTLPKDVILVGIVPHMHLIGRWMNVWATLPDGTRKSLIRVNDWDFNWQDEYYYERPFKLPAGTRLDVEASYDNSAENPANPSSPPQRVTYGEQTTDEMLFCFFVLTTEKFDDLEKVLMHSRIHDFQQPRGQTQSAN
jgi:acetyl esterase/lipase